MAAKSSVIKRSLFDRHTTRSSIFFRLAFRESQDVQRDEKCQAIGITGSKHGAHGFLRGVILHLSLMFALLMNGHAQDAQPTEYQIKAAFLFNFAKFVEWPPQAFAGPNSPMVVGVLGGNVFGDNLTQVLHNKTINNRTLEFRAYTSVADATNCQVLFICESEAGHFRKILKALQGTSVLTVSESDKFIENGGMINFVIQNNRIRFEINNDAAQKAGLKISSKLLSLAVSSR